MRKASMNQTDHDQPQAQRSESRSPTTCSNPTTASPARQTSPSSSVRTPSTPSTSHKDDPSPRRPPANRRKSRPNLHRLGSLTNPPTDPRDPYVERSYLMQNLQTQDRLAKHLLTRLSTAEERLSRAESQSSPTRTESPRKIKREISQLKARMADNAQQERLTLHRLSDLYVEIQGRERWDAVQRQKAQGAQPQPQYYYFQVQYPQAPPPTAVNGTFSHHSQPVEQFARMPEVEDGPMPTPFLPGESPLTPGFASCLSPLSPDFVPGSPFAENVFWAKGTRDDEEDEAGEETVERRSYTPTGSSARSSSVPRSTVCMPLRERRASVPPPRFMWSDEDAEEYDLMGDRGVTEV